MSKNWNKSSHKSLNRALSVLLVMAVVLFSTACGNKGDLYLPDDDTSETSETKDG